MFLGNSNGKMMDINKRLVIGVLMMFVGMISLMVLGGVSILEAIAVCFFAGVTSAGGVFIVNNY